MFWRYILKRDILYGRGVCDLFYYIYIYNIKFSNILILFFKYLNNK